ncbi:hypothetical protein ACJIZ3_016898 [Penstemon smallii]|uniref:Transmembrane protein n=1 Tax=Penstemon smallii TaxID=265156 RepID=A0ABD3SU14_9LAMI
MKNFTNPKQENQNRFSFHKPRNHPMPPQFSRGSFENVRLAGRSVGASMIAGSGESQGCCSINIYVNNDVQGINNSVLVGSDVKMEGLGVSLSMKELKMDRGQERDFEIWRLLLISFVVLAISFYAYLMMRWN